MTSPLHELARLHGLETSFTDAFGKVREAGPEPLLAALAALGAPVAKAKDVPDALRERRRALARRPCEPVIVAWDGAPTEVELHVPAARTTAPLACRVELEDGSVRAWTAQPARLPTPLLEDRDHAAVTVKLPELPVGTELCVDRVAAVDPEDLQMHYTAMLAARGLGDDTRAAREERLFLRFKADESAQAITERPRLTSAEDNNERQPIHEHETTPRAGDLAPRVR